MAETRYCLCCDDEVPFSILERDARREVVCAYCGFSLDVQKISDAQKPFENSYALIADDSQFTRKIIEDLLKEKEYAAHITSFENGLGLVSKYSQLLSEKQEIDVAIIDLHMPVMDGLTAARAIRSLEEKNQSRKVPIVFFSSVKADDILRKQFERLEPAHYINKGSDPHPEQLLARVEYLVNYVKEKYKSPA